MKILLLLALMMFVASTCQAQDAAPTSAPTAAKPAPRGPRDPSTIPPAVHPELPTIWLIGDSTVNNGGPPKYGWGEVFHHRFDLSKVNVVNKAIGGRSSRTFFMEPRKEKDGSITISRRWDDVASKIKPGDFVLMQFGHNDSNKPDDKDRPRGTIRGSGDDTVEITHPLSGEKETVHSFGWYIRTFVKGTKEKGGTPIVLSLIPRSDEKPAETYPANGYPKICAEVAQQEGVLFIDLNGIIHKHYTESGLSKEEILKKYFIDEHTHTGLPGANFNADCIVEGIKANPECELNKFLK